MDLNDIRRRETTILKEITDLDKSPKETLEEALTMEFSRVVVIGEFNDGSFCLSGSDITATGDLLMGALSAMMQWSENNLKHTEN